ncbi:MAG: VWA domain-containing protein [Brumimicrobium sp.]|nr:VWA domain-containing protein [Brumimicrobium sp.]
MRFLIILLFLYLIPWSGISQIVFDKTSYDFGDIYDNDTRYVDFYLKNKTGKDAFILSVKRPMDVVYIQKSALILPDSSGIIRFQISKNSKGSFSYTIPVFTSDKNEPTNITLKGKIVSLPTQDVLTACPDFNQRPGEGNPLDFILTVETIDKETREPIGKSDVAILQNGKALGKWQTNSKGTLKVKVPLGIAYFYGSHEGYSPDEKGLYINFKQNHVILELAREKGIPQEELIVDNPPIKEEFEERVIEIPSDPIKEDNIDLTSIFKKDKEDIPIQTTETTDIPIGLSELDENNFDDTYFDPINVVFVIDVSSSMAQGNRLDLLKYSLNQLVEMIRPQDKIGLVSYADNAQILLAPTKGDQKEKIMERVKDLKASGFTAGEAGIKLGYKQVSKAMIKNGRNHVIIITDGAFNRNSGNYKKFIEKNFKKKDITLSVVGIKSNPNAEANMTEAALLGNGRFILINGLEDAQRKLKQEIRITSYKYK